MSRAQEQSIKGTLIESATGSPMPFANVQNLRSRTVTITDTLGRFEIKALSKDTIEFSFIGYENVKHLALDILSTRQVKIQSISTVLEEVEVSTTRSRSMEQFDKVRSMQSLGKDIVFELPSMAGEPDFVKVITLLPGAAKGVEGSNDFFIRGGAADQNLVLLDGAAVYNTGHLFGFLSVFNPSTVGEVNLMTGGFPAEYGGRLSSIIDIRSKVLDKKQFNLEGGIGLISSRISAEIPVIKNKMAIQIAGRRTYADQVVKLVGSELPYYFYDMNFNVDYEPNESTRIHYGFYAGDDVLNFRGEDDSNDDPSSSSFILGNTIHAFTLEKDYKNFSSTTDINYTRFDYDIDNAFEDNRLNVVSSITDVGLSHKFTYPLPSKDQLHIGFSTLRRGVNNNLVDAEGELAEVIPSSEGEQSNVFESAFFGEWEFKRGKLQGTAGLRISTAMLPGKNYWEPEPRVALRYALKDDLALKMSYTRMAQYIHRVSSSSFALPTDVWYPVDDIVKPQTAHQWTFGVNKLIEDKGFVLGLEAYFKRMDNLVEFREGTNLVLNPDFRDDLLQGVGRSYGLEASVRKDLGKFRGWLSYTLSWTERQFDELNQGNVFPARYDRRNNASIVGNYQLNKRWTFSAVWEFISGARFTPIIGYYGVPNASFTGVDLIPQYTERNAVKLADTHRLDVSIILRGKEKPGKKWRGDWHFSVYNVYNRATPIAIDIIFEEETGSYRYEQPGLLGLLPSVTYNFRFR